MSQTPPQPLPVEPVQPVPVESLPYAPPPQDVWAAVLRAIANIATVFAGLQLFSFACQFGLAFSGSRSFASMQFSFANFPSTVAMLTQLALAAGAIVTLTGSLGRQFLRPGARTRMLTGLWIAVVAELLAWIVRTVTTFGGGFPRSAGSLGTVMFAGYTFGLALARILLPAVLIWVLSRAVVRQQYDGSVALR